MGLEMSGFFLSLSVHISYMSGNMSVIGTINMSRMWVSGHTCSHNNHLGSQR